MVDTRENDGNSDGNDGDNVRRFFSAASLERAVLEAARHYGLAPEELAYEPFDKRQGFIKRRKVVIKVDPASPRLSVPRSAAPEPAAPPASAAAPADRSGPSRPPATSAVTSSPAASAAAPPRAPAAVVKEPVEAPAPGDQAAAEGDWISLPDSPAELRRRRPAASARAVTAARSGLDLLFGLAGLELDAEVYQGADGIEVELSGAHADQVLEDEGQVLRALEHLLPRVMLQDLGEVVNCAIDCEGFQILREERLRSRAQQAAAEVRRRGAAETLEPMHPADRRVVHLVLADDAAVTTESVGRGYFRRVTVRPV